MAADTSSRHSPLIWLVFLVIVIDLVGFGLVIPLLPFMAPNLGGDSTDVAFIMITYALGAALVSPAWGKLSDKAGRRQALVLALLCSCVAYVVTALADTLWQVYLGRALSGLAAGSLPVATALMADLSPPQRRAKAMGLVGTAFGLGLIAGPVLGGLLTGDSESFALPFYTAAVMSLVAAICAQTMLPARMAKPVSSRPEMAENRAPAPAPALGPKQNKLLLMQYVSHTCSVSSIIYLFPLWVADAFTWGPKDVGYFFGVVGVAMITLQGGLLAVLTKVFGHINVLRVGSVTFAISLFVVATAEITPWMPAMIFLAFCGSTVCLPLLNAIASEIVDPSHRGRMMGMTASASSTGRIVGPLFAAGLLNSRDFSTAWLGSALMVLFLVIWSFTAARKFNRLELS
ncbi:MAG: MFS transporter [Gammaproteobacteria bacterium]|jgi:DHA1 family tetracycline resistance protein-like MFS transporter|nr:MFS transporter [Gammaproteobacteria bacterium]